MKCFATRCVAAALGLMLAAGNAMGQSYGSPTLLPLPEEPAPLGDRANDGAAQYRTVQHQVQLVNDGDENENGNESTVAPVPTPPPDSSSPGDAPVDRADAGGCAEGSCPADGGCADSCCGDDWLANWCGPGCNSGWFGSVGGMVLTRDRADGFWTSFESNNNANQILNTEDAESDWRGGWMISFGKWFGGCDPCGDSCGPRCGIGVTYFSTSPFRGSSTVFANDPLNNEWVSSTIDMDDALGPIQFPDGNEVDDYFDNSLSHSLERRDYIQSVEINLLSQYWQPNAHCQVTWLGGVRWFRFDESLLYSAVAGASTPTGSNEAFMDFDCTNDLVGFQLGARCDWYLTERFSLFVTPKFGLYGNHIQTHNRVYNGDDSELYDFSQDTTGVSFLGEVDLGASWQFAQHWRGFIGYKAIAVTGVALSDNQIPHYLAAADEFQQINSSGSLVVHGGFAGLEFSY